MCGTFLIRLLPPTNNRGFLPTPKETYDLNLSVITSSIRSFRTSTTIVCEGPEFYICLASIPSLAHTFFFLSPNQNFQYFVIMMCKQGLESASKC